MSKITMYSLNLVATHKCNLKCEHCMRGDQSNEVMKDEVIEEVAKKINGTFNLVITGGEPFLAPNFFNKLVLTPLPFCSLGIVTNGTVKNDKVLESIKRLINKPLTTLIGSSNLSISMDKYHNTEVSKLGLDASRKENIELLKQFCKENEMKFIITKTADDFILDEGRAKKLDIEKYNYNDYDVIFGWNPQDKYYEGDIIVDTDGTVSLRSNISYDNIKKYNIGNILDSDFEEMIKRRLVKNR